MSQSHSQGASAVLIRPSKVKKPNRWAVVFYNDDVTTMEFVVEVLMEVFNKEADEAFQLMMTVHQQGSAVAAVYSKDIAETKRALATEKARANHFPLKIELIEVKSP